MAGEVNGGRLVNDVWYALLDCNSNGIGDECDIAAETSSDANSNGTPDECETTCDPPNITIQPASQTDCEGSTVSLAIDATGMPTPTYQWRKHGVSIDGATGNLFMIEDATSDTSATYDVAVSNECGSIISDAAVVVVWPLGTGDVNGDGVIDGLDIGAFVQVFMASPNGPASLAFCAADLNRDGGLNQLDTVQLVVMLLGG